MARKRTAKNKDRDFTETKVSETAIATPKSDGKVSIEATQNTRLTDGTFLAKGETTRVSKEYAERIKNEGDSHFIIRD